ncbi:RDD family protein [Yinghuangia aomiensis]
MPQELPPASRFLRLVARTLDYPARDRARRAAVVRRLPLPAGQSRRPAERRLPEDVLALLRGERRAMRSAPMPGRRAACRTPPSCCLPPLVLAHLLPPTLYDWLMHARYGRTLGKMAVGIKVVGPDGTSRIGLARAARRGAVAVLAAVGRADAHGTSFFFFFTSPSRRNWSLAASAASSARSASSTRQPRSSARAGAAGTTGSAARR